MDFGDALRALKSGKRVQRLGWAKTGRWIELCVPPKEPSFLQINYPDNPNIHFSWLAAQLDVLAEDWRVVE